MIGGEGKQNRYHARGHGSGFGGDAGGAGGARGVIPGLPDDLAMKCLARIPCCMRAHSQAVSRAWLQVFKSYELYAVRREEGLLEELLVVECSSISAGVPPPGGASSSSTSAAAAAAAAAESRTAVTFKALDPVHRAWLTLPPLDRCHFLDTPPGKKRSRQQPGGGGGGGWGGFEGSSTPGAGGTRGRCEGGANGWGGFDSSSAGAAKSRGAGASSPPGTVPEGARWSHRSKGACGGGARGGVGGGGGENLSAASDAIVQRLRESLLGGEHSTPPLPTPPPPPPPEGQGPAEGERRAQRVSWAEGFLRAQEEDRADRQGQGQQQEEEEEAQEDREEEGEEAEEEQGQGQEEAGEERETEEGDGEGEEGEGEGEEEEGEVKCCGFTCMGVGERLFVMGGSLWEDGAFRGTSRRVWCLDMPASAWREAERMGAARHRGFAAGVVGGRVVVAGGKQNATAAALDPATGRWARLADLPPAFAHHAGPGHWGVVMRGRFHIVQLNGPCNDAHIPTVAYDPLLSPFPSPSPGPGPGPSRSPWHSHAPSAWPAPSPAHAPFPSPSPASSGSPSLSSPLAPAPATGNGPGPGPGHYKSLACATGRGFAPPPAPRSTLRAEGGTGRRRGGSSSVAGSSGGNGVGWAASRGGGSGGGGSTGGSGSGGGSGGDGGSGLGAGASTGRGKSSGGEDGRGGGDDVGGGAGEGGSGGGGGEPAARETWAAAGSFWRTWPWAFGDFSWLRAEYFCEVGGFLYYVRNKERGYYLAAPELVRCCLDTGAWETVVQIPSASGWHPRGGSGAGGGGGGSGGGGGVGGGRGAQNGGGVEGGEGASGGGNGRSCRGGSSSMGSGGGGGGDGGRGGGGARGGGGRGRCRREGERNWFEAATFTLAAVRGRLAILEQGTEYDESGRALTGACFWYILDVGSAAGGSVGAIGTASSSSGGGWAGVSSGGGGGGCNGRAEAESSGGAGGRGSVGTGRRECARSARAAEHSGEGYEVAAGKGEDLGFGEAPGAGAAGVSSTMHVNGGSNTGELGATGGAAEERGAVGGQGDATWQRPPAWPRVVKEEPGALEWPRVIKEMEPGSSSRPSVINEEALWPQNGMRDVRSEEPGASDPSNRWRLHSSVRDCSYDGKGGAGQRTGAALEQALAEAGAPHRGGPLGAGGASAGAGATASGCASVHTGAGAGAGVRVRWEAVQVRMPHPYLHKGLAVVSM